MPRTKAASTPIPTIDPQDSWFPSLRKTLKDNPSLFADLHLVCNICTSDMLIAGDGRPKYPRRPSRIPEDKRDFACGEGPGSDPHKDSIQKALAERKSRGLEPQDPCMVMFCGHIFCESCALLHSREMARLDCPLCKELLVGASCERDENHRVTMIPFPATSVALRKFPPTKAEGGQLPVSCMWCMLNLYMENLALKYQLHTGRGIFLKPAVCWTGFGTPPLMCGPPITKFLHCDRELDLIREKFVKHAQRPWAADRLYLPGLTLGLVWVIERRGAISE